MTTWDVTEPTKLDLDPAPTAVTVWLASGRLHVVGTDGPARVEVSTVGTRGIQVSYEDGVLDIRHDVDQRWRWTGPLWWFLAGRKRYQADVSIAVPRSAFGTLTLVAGSAVVSGLSAGASVEVTSGRITLLGLAGTVHAKTVSGSIEALGVGGELRLETVSGEIILADSSAGRVLARAISGSITCDLDNPYASDVQLETTSGEITARVPEDADLEVRLRATSGRVTSAFPQVRHLDGPHFRTLSGRLGTGSGALSAYAVSGNVSLLARPVPAFADDIAEDSE
jgi:hypothetical protein